MTNVSNNVSLCHYFDSFVLLLRNLFRCCFDEVSVLCLMILRLLVVVIILGFNLNIQNGCLCLAVLERNGALCFGGKCSSVFMYMYLL